MSCPTLADLPPPPPGRTGWPWTEASPPLPPMRRDGSAWPRITIVTPSYNQGEFIEETIRSVLLQGYSNLEYMVMDGGSTDGAVDVIRKYERWLDHWESAPDKGQSHAINKGLKRATGTIFQWINSDDIVEPHALHHVASVWRQNTGCVAGSVVNFAKDQPDQVIQNANLTSRLMITGRNGIVYHQPGVWLASEYMRAVGLLPEDIHYSFDAGLMIKYLDEYPDVVTIDRPLVRFRLHRGAKTATASARFAGEDERLRSAIAQSTSVSRTIRKAAERELALRAFIALSGTVLRSESCPLQKVIALIGGSRPTIWRDRYFLGSLRRAVFG